MEININLLHSIFGLSFFCLLPRVNKITGNLSIAKYKGGGFMQLMSRVMVRSVVGGGKLLG